MKHVVEQLIGSGCRTAWVVAGGGSGAVDAVLRTPGASRFMLEVQVPYSRAAMTDYLGVAPESYCSAATARRMAERALERARAWVPDAPVLGVACTAALKTSCDRVDADRAFICICSAERRVEFELTLESGSRDKQENRVSAELLARLAEFVAE